VESRVIGDNLILEARFILSNVQEKNFLDENAFYIFEPTLKFEIDGRDVFKSIGINDGIDNTVIFPSIKEALRETRRMIADLGKNSDKNYKYWFLGTGYGLRVHMQGKNLLQINLDVDSDFGPVKGNMPIKDTKYLGEITLKGWVNCIVALSKELVDSAVRVNPSLKHILTHQENQTSILEDWMEVSNSQLHPADDRR
jgi:hypothetical protein